MSLTRRFLNGLVQLVDQALSVDDLPKERTTSTEGDILMEIWLFFKNLSAEQPVTSTVVTVSGTVAAGAYSILFETSSTFTGTINGVARTANFKRSYTARDNGTLGEMPYEITAGSITIEKIV